MKEVLFWRNVPILEKLGVEQFNHMIGKGFRKGGILMKQQLFHHFVAGKIQRLLRLIVVDGLINDIGTVGIQKPFEYLILQRIFCCSRIFELFDLAEGTDANPQNMTNMIPMTRPVRILAAPVIWIGRTPQKNSTKRTSPMMPTPVKV